MNILLKFENEILELRDTKHDIFENVRRQDTVVPFLGSVAELKGRNNIMQWALEEYDTTMTKTLEFAKSKRFGGYPAELTMDEAAAIILFASEFSGTSNIRFCDAVNSVLRERNRAFVKPFEQYLWLFVGGLKKCPIYKGRYLYRQFRFIDDEIYHEILTRYACGEILMWYGFGSCTSEADRSKSQQDNCVVFKIELISDNARVISEFSQRHANVEILLPCDFKFSVTAHSTMEGGATVISLLEEDYCDPLWGTADTMGYDRNSIFSPDQQKQRQQQQQQQQSHHHSVDFTLNNRNAGHASPSLLTSNSTSRLRTSFERGGSGKTHNVIRPSNSSTGLSVSAAGGNGSPTGLRASQDDHDELETEELGPLLYPVNTSTVPVRSSFAFMGNAEWGTVAYPSGDVYEGESVLTYRQGDGKMTYANKEFYDGQWVGGKKHGVGKFVNKLGECYDGNWSQDVRCGQGVCSYSTGSLYTGEWSNDLRHGMGTINYKNGNSYVGDWEHDLRCGHGVFNFAGGAMYDGNWANDKANGYGVLTFQSGEYYKGDWVDDKKHGHGIYKFGSGDVYDGDWKDDRMNGQTMYKYINGAKYKGEWSNGMKNGTGLYTYINGETYDGEWKDDKKHGMGTFTDSVGDSITCKWVEGKREESAMGSLVANVKSGACTIC